ncbi:uncharacterized protein LOC135095827 isoform X2 [Scylla paramamosain]|uniref:uncharacterized protein LOC135095827 isoform X2 n=1 Tax=Scylla paramamosain TaxID=85552 RepID=UPI0030833434
MFVFLTIACTFNAQRKQPGRNLRRSPPSFFYGFLFFSRTRRDLFLEDTEGEFIDQYRLSKEVTLDLLAKIEHLLPTSETNRGVLRYLLVLSAYTNLGKILHMNHKASPGNITCLHALRFSGLVPVPTSVATHESPHLHHLSAGTAPAEPGQGLLLHPPQHGDNQCMVLQTYTAAL